MNDTIPMRLVQVLGVGDANRNLLGEHCQFENQASGISLVALVGKSSDNWRRMRRERDQAGSAHEHQRPEVPRRVPAARPNDVFWSSVQRHEVRIACAVLM